MKACGIRCKSWPMPRVNCGLFEEIPMFVRENSYAIARKKSIETGRTHLNLEGQKQWPTSRSGAKGITIPNGSAFAQNDAYLELCNSGWNLQWRAGIGNPYVILPALLIVWMWYGL